MEPENREMFATMLTQTSYGNYLLNSLNAPEIKDEIVNRLAQLTSSDDFEFDDKDALAQVQKGQQVDDLDYEDEFAQVTEEDLDSMATLLAELNA